MGGKTVLVAGGTGGLGRAVSLAFLEKGYSVAVTYRSASDWDSLQARAKGALEGFRVDLRDEAAVKDVVAKLAEKRGSVDALVNAVGGYVGGVKLWEVDAKVLENLIALNLGSGFVLAKAVAPVMIRQGHGVIVNVAARAAVDHAAGASAYAATKAAAVAMMDSLAADLKGTGVRVNSILPSIIDTEANRKAMPDANFAKWPKPEEIAKVILFLCSDDAKLLDGAAVPV